MVYAATTCKYTFAMQPGDVYWCTADCGWITGEQAQAVATCRRGQACPCLAPAHPLPQSATAAWLTPFLPPLPPCLANRHRQATPTLRMARC